MKRYVLPFLILVSSLYYIFFNPSHNATLSLLAKLLPMALIFLYGVIQPYSHSTNYKRILLVGLMTCALGDALLGYSFIFGLIAFLVGHLFYIVAFTRLWQPSKFPLLIIFLISITAVILGYKLTTELFLSGQNLLILPIIFYIIVISIMCATASMSRNIFAITGSILFMISDSALAWNMFISPLPFDSIIVMSTYYVAQFLITTSASNGTLASAFQNENNTQTLS